MSAKLSRYPFDVFLRISGLIIISNIISVLILLIGGLLNYPVSSLKGQLLGGAILILILSIPHVIIFFVGIYIEI